ncbi:MAG: hypothetical protein AMXMBFR84_12750 [Candidatus Hydrogenedentota bacterium]
MKTTKLSAQVFLELPPVIAHYIEGDRNSWLESSPSKGRILLCSRPGQFDDLEMMAVERRQLLEILGPDRARAFCFRMGFEQGRREAARYFNQYERNTRLGLQAGLVFGQLQGRYLADHVRFEFDLDRNTLYRELRLLNSMEAAAHRMAQESAQHPVCWITSGNLSGQISEILGRRVLVLETECAANGAEACVFIGRLDHEWQQEADWARQALKLEPIEDEIARRDEMIDTAQRAARKAQAALIQLSRKLRSELMFDTLVAETESMQRVIRRAEQLAASEAPALLVGEPGVGRSTLARAIHHGGTRKEGPFVQVDCSVMTPEALHRELVGAMQDPLSGVSRQHIGALTRAHQGTLYLHEITQAGPDVQAVLLRAMNEQQVHPIGNAEPVPTNARIIAGTELDPEESLKSNSLRNDLYYALAVGRIEIPPLRDRANDIVRLAQLFLAEYRERHERPDLQMSESFKRALMECPWPGNIRQLRHVIEHAVVFSKEKELDVADLPEDFLVMRAAQRPRELTEDVIRAVLRKAKGNRSQAADILGVGRTTLWRAMKRYNIE